MRHSAVGAIRRALIQGPFQPGEALSDVALAAEMATSRGPVREALLVLTEEGRVRNQQNRGFFVPRFTRQDAEEVQRARHGGGLASEMGQSFERQDASRVNAVQSGVSPVDLGTIGQAAVHCVVADFDDSLLRLRAGIPARRAGPVRGSSEGTALHVPPFPIYRERAEDE